MADEHSRKCPECDGAMAPIQLHDKVHRTGSHEEVEYSLPGDRPSFWLGIYPAAGTVAAFMCGGCGRINLYGVPKAE
jgi:hypothetical protein